MDSTLAGLLQGCAETPDDGTPHRILADWLDDHDQPERAELLRLQCRLADWVPDWRERLELIQRQNELLAAHSDQWLGPLGDFCEHVEFVRGLARVWVRGLTFARKAFGAAYTHQRQTALIEQVRLRQSRSFKTISRCPWLGYVPSLSLAELKLDDEALPHLQASTNLGSLVALDLSGTGIDASGVERVQESPWFSRLARLALRHNRLPVRVLMALIQHSPDSLLDLDLANTTMNTTTLQALATRLPASRVMNSLGMEFVRVPAGSFLMGAGPEDTSTENNQRPQHEVTLTRAIWMGRFEVTQDVYERLMGTNPSDNTRRPSLPVEMVNFPMAEEFCARLSALPSETATGRSYRLPTEAEWEHACRAGTFTSYHFGNEPRRFLFNSQPGFSPIDYDQVYEGQTTPVGSFPPNAFGLYDMHGNVWEWTGDLYGLYGEDACTNPVGAQPGAEGRLRSIRGGCWTAVTGYCRSFHRYGETPERRDRYTGFRVVLEQRT